jgi:hypothetical protein
MANENKPIKIERATSRTAHYNYKSGNVKLDFSLNTGNEREVRAFLAILKQATEDVETLLEDEITK